MHFKHSLLLLACAIAGISQDALALPFNQPAGIIHLPLKPVEHRRRDLHSQILHQQKMNRAYRRFARMTGREEPSSNELRSNLIQRLESLGASVPEISTRFSPIVDHQGKRFRGRKKGGARVGNSGASSSTAAAAATDTALSATATDAAGSAASTTDTAAASGATNNASSTGVTQANPPTDKNSLGLDIEGNDIGYLATVQMGTPPQNFLLLMDSGSADLWVGSENCKSDGGGGCGNHNFLGTQSSSSFVDSGVPWNITYGTGSVSGTKVTDNLAIAGLALPGHNFGVANTESVDFSDNSVPFDGLMGLAKSTLSEQKNPTPVESLASNNLISAAITSYKIPRLLDNKNDGEITFGGLDTAKFDPATLVTLKNVSPLGFWEASMDAVSVSGKDLGLAGRTAILDTGTTLIIAPASDATTVHNAIPGAKSDGQGGFTVPCTTTASVALTFGGTSFAIDTRDLAVQPVNAANPNGDCVSGIASGNVGGPTEWLVGDVFLKNAYFSHDVGANKIQLAKLV